nr:large conductance mechanosensitive channel protein MscL [Fimbriimonas ginsengisoli]
MLKEFREFAVKGNVIDLAVGVIIGGAFGKIVTSIVEDIVMPPISLLLGSVPFADLLWVVPGQQAKIDMLRLAHPPKELKTAADYKAAAIATVNYGQFLSNVVQFLIIAFVVFLMVKAINKARTLIEPPAAPGEPVTKQCPYCLSDIPIKASRCKFCTSEV